MAYLADALGRRTVSSSGGITSTVPNRTFSVPPKPIQVSGRPGDWRWPFSNPGYWMQPMFTLAVGGPGGGDPALGQFPAAMLVDYLRVW